MSVLEGLGGFTYRAEAAAWTMFALSSVIFIMRCISRIGFTEIGLGWDDVVLGVSWLLNIVRMTSLELALVGMRHINVANLPETGPRTIFWVVFTSNWSFLSITLPKIAVAILLVRIFRPRVWLRRAILWTPIGLFVYCFAGFILGFLQCKPASALWDPWHFPNANCWPSTYLIHYAEPGAAMSAFLDLAFAAYPGVVIWQLRMPKWQKFSTIGLMSLGLLSFACAVIKIFNNTKSVTAPSLDARLTYFAYVGLWSGLENDFVLMAASLPSVRPLLALLHRELISVKQRAVQLFSSARRSSAQSRRNGDDDSTTSLAEVIHVTRSVTMEGTMVAKGDERRVTAKYDA